MQRSMEPGAPGALMVDVVLMDGSVCRYDVVKSPQRMQTLDVQPIK